MLCLPHLLSSCTPNMRQMAWARIRTAASADCIACITPTDRTDQNRVIRSSLVSRGPPAAAAGPTAAALAPPARSLPPPSHQTYSLELGVCLAEQPHQLPPRVQVGLVPTPSAAPTQRVAVNPAERQQLRQYSGACGVCSVTHRSACTPTSSERFAASSGDVRSPLRMMPTAMVAISSAVGRTAGSGDGHQHFHSGTGYM